MDVKTNLLDIINFVINQDDKVKTNVDTCTAKEAASTLSPKVKELWDYYMKCGGKIDLSQFDSTFFNGLLDIQRRYLAQCLFIGVSELANGFVKKCLEEEAEGGEHPLMTVLSKLKEKGALKENEDGSISIIIDDGDVPVESVISLDDSIDDDLEPPSVELTKEAEVESQDEQFMQFLKDRFGK